MKYIKNSVICVNKPAVLAWEVTVLSWRLLLRNAGTGVVVGLFHICWTQYVKVRLLARLWRS
jgi:hypothetical protein